MVVLFEPHRYNQTKSKINSKNQPQKNHPKSKPTPDLRWVLSGLISKTHRKSKTEIIVEFVIMFVSFGQHRYKKNQKQLNIQPKNRPKKQSNTQWWVLSGLIPASSMRHEDQEDNLLALVQGRGVLSHQPATPTSGWSRMYHSSSLFLLKSTSKFRPVKISARF